MCSFSSSLLVNRKKRHDLCSEFATTVYVQTRKVYIKQTKKKPVGTQRRGKYFQMCTGYYDVDLKVFIISILTYTVRASTWRGVCHFSTQSTSKLGPNVQNNDKRYKDETKYHDRCGSPIPKRKTSTEPINNETNTFKPGASSLYNRAEK